MSAEAADRADKGGGGPSHRFDPAGSAMIVQTAINELMDGVNSSSTPPPVLFSSRVGTWRPDASTTQ